MIGLFCEEGIFGKDYILRIGDVEEIKDQLANLNDWMCLIAMGRSMGPKSDQPKLKKLHRFLTTCETKEELENFKIRISTGELGCIMCAETECEFEKMRNFILFASEIKAEHLEKVERLLDKLKEYFSSEESRYNLHCKFSRMQYIRSGIARDDYLD